MRRDYGFVRQKTMFRLPVAFGLGALLAASSAHAQSETPKTEAKERAPASTVPVKTDKEQTPATAASEKTNQERTPATAAPVKTDAILVRTSSVAKPASFQEQTRAVVENAARKEPPVNAATSAEKPAGQVEQTEKAAPVANTAVLGAAAPTPPPVPYQVFFTLGFQSGTGTFIAGANRESVGYTLSLAGLYRLTNVLDGRLDIFTSLNADQSLTANSQGDVGSVAPREFFFRDIRIGVLGRSLLNSKSTGIILGANVSIDLPTSLQAQAQGRFVRTNLSGNAARIFSGIGPGSLLVRLTATARWDLGDVVFTNTTNSALCNSVSVNSQGECLSGRTGNSFVFIPGVGLTYLWGRVNFAASISFINSWQYSSSNSIVPRLTAGDNIEPGRSPNALNDTPYSLITSTNLSVTYTASSNLLFTLGLATAQAPVDKCNQDRDDFRDTGQCVQFPFFDFNNQTNNLSSFYLNTTLMY
ncbi:MAG: hypothetical protein AAFN74_23015 [Myxococcota bacterium]